MTTAFVVKSEVSTLVGTVPPASDRVRVVNLLQFLLRSVLFRGRVLDDQRLDLRARLVRCQNQVSMLTLNLEDLEAELFLQVSCELPFFSARNSLLRELDCLTFKRANLIKQVRSLELALEFLREERGKERVLYCLYVSRRARARGHLLLAPLRRRLWDEVYDLFLSFLS